MNIRQHAVRRYKQRIGDRTASRQRIIRKINKEIENSASRTCYNKRSRETGYYRIVTKKFVAVCYKNTVMTVRCHTESEKVMLNDKAV